MKESTPCTSESNLSNDLRRREYLVELSSVLLVRVTGYSDFNHLTRNIN